MHKHTHRFKKGGCGFDEVFAERRDTIRRKVRKPLRLLKGLKSMFVSKGHDYSNLLQSLVLCRWLLYLQKRCTLI